MIRFVFVFCFFIVYLAFYQPGKGQNVSGRIVDRKSGDPVPATNVFFANYQTGTFADESGYFELKIPDKFPLQLVISHIAYNSKTIYIDSLPDKELLQIQLIPRVAELDEVKISAEIDKEWNRNIRNFTGAFLGQTENSRKCRIINPHVINFDIDNGFLKAYADELIIIENLATGFKIHFLLEYFSMKIDQVSFSGKPYFEPIESENSKEQARWSKNRKETFYGSQRHFFLTLLDKSMFAAGYEVVSGRLGNDEAFFFKGLIGVDEIVVNENNKSFLNLKNTLKVVYTKEMDPSRSSIGMEQFIVDNDNQTSYISGRLAKIQMSENGILYRPDLIEVFGYWAREGVADLLPFDYYPGN